MANIIDKIVQIRQAIFGKDVRESIASGIENINAEVESTTKKQELLETEFDEMIINAGNSNAEIVQARVDADGKAYVNLQERMNTVDSHLAEKAAQQSVKDIVQVNIRDYGAVGDGVTNDYQSFVDACNVAGEFGVVYFPETTNNIYYMSNGLSGTDGRIKMQGRPYLKFAKPTIKLKYYYDPDLKYLKTLTPFLLEWNGKTKVIDTIDLQKKTVKTGALSKNPSQVLSKLNFTTDVIPQNFIYGTTFNNITGLLNLTADSMKFDKEASGTNLIMRALSQGKYMECLLEKDATIPTGGFYAMCVKSNLYAYIYTMDALNYSYTLNRYLLSDGSVTVIKSNVLPNQYQLKENRAMLYGVKNVDNLTFEIYINGYLIDTLIITGETYDKVGIGHARHLNDLVTISYGLEITNYNNPKYTSPKLFSFGDSITFGAYSYKDYPTLIADILFREKGIRDIRVDNRGVSGDKSIECLTRVNTALPDIATNSIVTVQIGTNDCIGGIDIETYITNMASIIDTIRTKTQKLIIASFPVYDTTIANYAKIGLYNARLKQLCISKSVKFVDNMGNFGYNLDLYNDGIHPTEEGLLILAKSFADAIVEIV